jgi:site-specific DNA-methyltransferase (adenine-specific)
LEREKIIMWTDLFSKSGDVIYNSESGLIFCGNSLTILKNFPASSIDCVVCSPPYYKLRHYKAEPQIYGGDKDCVHKFSEKKEKILNLQPYNPDFKRPCHEKASSVISEGQFCERCNAWLGNIGEEPSVELYIEHLMSIFREVKRILKKTGTLFVNISDTFKKNSEGLHLVPFYFTIAMADMGFILHNTIIWHKPNVIPSSAKRRFTIDFEPIFFFSKTKFRYFKQQLEPYKTLEVWSRAGSGPGTLYEDNNPRKRWGLTRKELSTMPAVGGKKQAGGQNPVYSGNRPNWKDGRNMRTTWPILTQPSTIQHFGMFPEELPRRCILAGCPKHGIVLDLFNGAGRTTLVAHNLGVKFIGIDLSEEYCKYAKEGLSQKVLL